MPSAICAECGVAIGYEPATLCLGCDQLFHDDDGCFDGHRCPAVVKVDAAKLSAWEQSAKGWRC